MIPALGRLRQLDLEFKTSLGYTVRPCLKNNSNNNNILSITEYRLYICKEERAGCLGD
jgi:hypothetical protein